MLPLLLLAGGTALASPSSDTPSALAPQHPMHPAPHDEHPAPGTLVGVKVLGGLALEPHHRGVVRAASLFAEQVVVPDALELELALGWARHHGRSTLPVELLLKTPLRHRDRLELHGGLGAVAALPVRRKQPTRVGSIATLDLFHWWTDQVGGVLEVNVQAYPVGDHALVEAELGVGMATRF